MRVTVTAKLATIKAPRAGFPATKMLSRASPTKVVLTQMKVSAKDEEVQFQLEQKV